MQTVKLRNGTEEVAMMVPIIMMHLKSMFADDPIAAYEIVMHARDRNHPPWNETMTARFKSLSLLESDGRMHDTVRNIIVSAVTGDLLDMTLRDPRVIDTVVS